MPSSVGDLTVRCKTAEGKLTYKWGALEVEVTPRALRAGPCSGAPPSAQAWRRETTPQRALRKMQDKAKRVAARAKKGKYPPIVVRTLANVTDGILPAQELPRGALPPTAALPQAKALTSLTDPASVHYVREAFEYLDSMRLHYCQNCDEQWPVFDAPWPEGGAAYAGPLASRSESIARAGFEASERFEGMCSRCDTKSAYAAMFAENNLQHLGPRHDALSNLTWYESLLVARVHPVVSVITLTATGLLCYAGNVCNYYVKVLEWQRGLPAKLRDSRWFQIKRRKSLTASPAGQRQKKPTTANRSRLMAAFAKVQETMRHVFAGEQVDPTELAKFPVEGEKEMEEQEEHADLHGDMPVDEDMFTAWLQTQLPCASGVALYARDQQGQELRGSVDAWALCCRMLSLQADSKVIQSGSLAQLLVY